MLHLNATLTFDKREDESKIEEFQSILFSYNLICSMSDVKPLEATYVDCGDTVEFRVDTDLDFTNWDKLTENTEMMSKFLPKN